MQQILLSPMERAISLQILQWQASWWLSGHEVGIEQEHHDAPADQITWMLYWKACLLRMWSCCKGQQESAELQARQSSLLLKTMILMAKFLARSPSYLLRSCQSLNFQLLLYSASLSGSEFDLEIEFVLLGLLQCEHGLLVAMHPLLITDLNMKFKIHVFHPDSQATGMPALAHIRLLV